MPTREQQMLGAAIAGAAIATSLIEALIAKRILSEAEARVIVGDAQNLVTPYAGYKEGYFAQAILGDWLNNHSANGR